MHSKVIAAAIAVVLVTATVGCSSQDEPVLVSRATLGTAVTVTAYGDEGARKAVDSAFSAMDGLSATLDAYAPDTPITRFNQDPYTATRLPADAVAVLDAIDRLDVEDSFSVDLLGVSTLYGFESSETVPATPRLAAAVEAAHASIRDADTVAFEQTGFEGIPLPGLDFGGAAKGLGLDLALGELITGGVESAVISAGSTTVTLGEKPDGGPWRIGIEDPRDAERVVAVVEATVPCAVSTSGDYQRYFEVDGVRYHHILDPATGAPARGLRSLTVFGPYETLSGLDADILSTALFVMGLQRAEDHARSHGFGLYTVDAEGRARIVPAPEDHGVRLVIEAEPQR